ncbi:MAG: hypothetical protein RL701_6520 [Pseudomonadota bacterium]
MTSCIIGEPVSWLKLERYGLGELSEHEALQVAKHLQQCPVCGACYAQIEADAARVVAPLPAARSAPRRTRTGLALPARQLAVVGSLLSAALGAWLALGPDMEPPARRNMTGTKGGELALELVRVGRAGSSLEPGHFVPGDRFKVLFSCPPSRAGAVRVRVFQGDDVFEPLPPHQLENCGNRRNLPGAFALDGSDRVSVCVTLASSTEQLERVDKARKPGQLPQDSVCTRVLPMDPAE